MSRDFFALREEIEKTIATVQESISNYAIEELAEPLTALSELLTVFLKYIPVQKQHNLAEILNFLNTALENKDYLFLNDLLQYELTPLLETRMERI